MKNQGGYILFMQDTSLSRVEHEKLAKSFKANFLFIPVHHTIHPKEV